MNRPWVAQHPLLTLFVGMLAVGAVLAYWPIFLTLAVLGGTGYGAAVLIIRLDKHANEQRWQRQQIGARADYEHMLVMQGNPAGIYGRYPPAL